MTETIGNILNYTEPPDPAEHAKQSRVIWIIALASISMAVVGYLIIAYMIL